MRNLCLLFLVALTTGLVSDKLLVASQSSSLTADDLYLEGHTSGGLPIDDEDAEDTEDFNSGSGSGDYGFIEKSDKEDVLRKFLDFSTASPDKKVSPTEPTRSVAQSTRRPAVKVTPSVSLTDNDYDKKVPEAAPTEDRSRNKPNTPSSTPAESTTVGININVVEKEEDNSLDRWDDSKNKDQEKEEKKPEEEEEEDNEIKRAKMMEGNYNQVTSESMWERTEVLAAVIACVVVGCVCAIFLLFILAYRMKKKDEGSYDLGDTKISATAYQKAPTKEFYA